MNLIFCLGNRAFKSDVVIILDAAAAAAAGGDEFTVEGTLLLSTSMPSLLDVLSSSTDVTNNLVIVNGRVVCAGATEDVDNIDIDDDTDDFILNVDAS